MEQKQVYVLNRWVISEDDGKELQEPQVYATFSNAADAACEWMANVEMMLQDSNLEYKCDYENWIISRGPDKWIARIQHRYVTG